MSQDGLRRAAHVLRSAEALLIGAGAGMGVDSGLPDFRGSEGFWRAYPAYAKLGLDFAGMANPQWFQRDPALAWGFYGHRLGLYRATQPHPGFALLRSWAERMPRGAFVFTSNVDGQFQKAGFSEDRILEVHGSIHSVQCLGRCGELASASPFTVDVDPESFRARPPLPSCPVCGALLRP
ncbi:NAD-dependent deacetylase 1, partial [Stigmatella aurantiaca DW4/3-1]